MRKDICISTSILLLTLCVPFASAAALPTSVSLANADPLPVPSATLTLTGLCPVGTRVPFRYEDVILVFTSFGKTIPEIEVNNTLSGAELVAKEYLDRYPEHPIPNNRFEYLLPQGNVLLAITTTVCREITWRELYHVLQTLVRFVGHLEPIGPHYQELNFDIEFTHRLGIEGIGILRYFRTNPDEVQKRMITVFPLLSSNGTLLPSNSSDRSSLGPDPNNEFLYPIKGTTLTLDFFFFGLGLPRALVTENLELALKSVRPFSKGDYENTTIRGNFFQRITAGKTAAVATTIFPHGDPRHQISWGELYNALRGLNQFVIGINQVTTHFQMLGFRILNETQDKIGVGSLAYYDPQEVERRAILTDAIHAGSALTQVAESTNFSSPGVIREDAAISWRIPCTILTLAFTTFGLSIPLIEILALLEAARLQIASDVQGAPTQFIPDGSFHYENGLSTLVINFLAYEGKDITWLQVQQTLIGLSQFCTEDHSQALVFDIEAAGQGNIGRGAITSIDGPSDVNLGARRTPLLSAITATAIQVENPKYPIPGTAITLDIVFIGRTTISPVDLSATLTTALQEIGTHLISEGNLAIPGNEWCYHNKMSNVGLSVVVYAQRTLSWQQLSWTITGLLRWMTGPGLADCKTLAFGIEIAGQGSIGRGFVYLGSPSMASGIATTSRTEVDKRSALVNGSSLVLADELTLLPLGIMRTEEPIYWPIAYTNLTLVFTYLGLEVPGFGIYSSRMLEDARLSIYSYVERVPAQSITHNWFQFQEKFDPTPQRASVVVHALIDSMITWHQLDRILTGLFVFQKGAPVVGIKGHDQASLFDIVLDGVGTIGKGGVACGNPWERRAALSTNLANESILQWLHPTGSSPSVVPSKTISPQATNGTLKVLQGPAAVGLIPYVPPQPSTLASRSILLPRATNLTAPFQYVVNENVTLRIILNPTQIPASRIAGVFNGACHSIIPEVMHGPDDNYDKDIFFFQVDYIGGLELVSIEVHPRVNEHLTWMQLYQILSGLQEFLSGTSGAPHRQSCSFKIHIKGSYVAHGLLLYIFPPRDTPIDALSLPPSSNATITTPIPYPIIGTPITLAFTSLLPIPIPLYRLVVFFERVFAYIEENVEDFPDRTINRHTWSFRSRFNPTVEEISFIMHREVWETVTWKQLSQILRGLEDFMDGVWVADKHWQALAFNIEIYPNGVVAKGSLNYTPATVKSLAGLRNVSANDFM